MAHFAELDENNYVIRVIVINNEDIINNYGNEDENLGINLCESFYGHKNWKQTSYNASFRKNAAFPGCYYDQEIDAFIVPKPYDSWTLDSNCRWQPPIPHPEDGNSYGWNEELGTWEQTNAVH